MLEKAKNKKRLVLLDAHAILHRAYHALPDFTSSTGEPTGALYGLTAMLLKVVDDLDPDYIVACYDLPKPTYRHEVYKEYKAGRPKADDALIEQLERSRDVLEAFSVPIYEKEGFEADDILGTIVEQMKGAKDVEIIITSGDMDTLQLVDGKHVRVYTLRKGIKDTVVYDEKAVVDRFGFGPELLPDYKGLRGDPSDNIIGIAGIGEKTATALITTFGSIADIYKKLKKDKGQFEKKNIKPRIVKLLEDGKEEAEFSRMLAEIRRDAPIAFSLPKKDWKDELNPNKVLELFKTLGFKALSERVRKRFGGHEDVVIASVEKKQTESGSVDEKNVKESAVALWILNSEMTNPTREDILEFAGTSSLKKAHEHILMELEKQGLERVYRDIEKPLIGVVEGMEERGVKIDTEHLTQLSKRYHKELSTFEKSIWRHAGEKFNINSPKQLGDVLFDTLGLGAPKQKRTATGQRSTRESELQKLTGEHPIIDDIIRYRELQKLLSTYIDNIPHMVGGDNRLHASFLQAGTTTGRMSSQNPNLQNIPIRTKLGRAVRNAFVAEKRFTLVSFDYSQIELRVSAILSGDKKMTEIFKSGGDIHTTVAAEVFKVSLEKVTKEMRRKAKIINFGIHYGMGANALSKTIGVKRNEAQEFLNEYFKQFAGLSDHIARTKATTKQRGYTETLFGRRRYVPGITSRIPYVRAEAERIAVNAPVQGTQADIIKIAMKRVDEYIKKEGLEEKVFLVLQIHDELIYEVVQEVVHMVVPEIQAIMESVLTKSDTNTVPIVADVLVGKNWGDMKPYANL